MKQVLAGGYSWGNCEDDLTFMRKSSRLSLSDCSTTGKHSLPMQSSRFLTNVLKLAAIYNLVWGAWVILYPNHLFDWTAYSDRIYPGIMAVRGNDRWGVWDRLLVCREGLREALADSVSWVFGQDFGTHRFPSVGSDGPIALDLGHYHSQQRPYLVAAFWNDVGSGLEAEYRQVAYAERQADDEQSHAHLRNQ